MKPKSSGHVTPCSRCRKTNTIRTNESISGPRYYCYDCLLAFQVDFDDYASVTGPPKRMAGDRTTMTLVEDGMGPRVRTNDALTVATPGDDGYASPRAPVARTLLEAFPGIEGTALFSRLRRAMQERWTDAFDTEFTYPDGTRRWFEIRVQPVREGLCIYSVDIHERKMAEQRLKQKVAGLEASLEAQRGVLHLIWSLLRPSRHLTQWDPC